MNAAMTEQISGTNRKGREGKCVKAQKASRSVDLGRLQFVPMPMNVATAPSTTFGVLW